MTNIKTIGVIGSGQMGAGIAQVAAMSGYTAILWDANPAAVDKGISGIKSSLQKFVEKEKITKAQESAALGLLKPAHSVQDFASCNLVIEAIVEDEAIKKDIYKKVDAVLQPHAIIASNTSSISITRLGAATSRPEKFIGMHFMNPVPLMKLVEVIRGLPTTDDTYNSICAVSAQMGKTVVTGIDTPGFIVNRILCPMINEAIFLLQEGVKAEDIDNAMKLGTNHPMGPLQLADFVGLDTLFNILGVLHRELGEDKYRPCPLLRKYVEAGWYGKKAGRGFYRY